MQSWLESPECSLRIRFTHVVNLILQAAKSVSAAANHDKVLLLGGTGVGKSTFVNYMNGTRYLVSYDDAGFLSAKRRCGAAEIAKTGQGMISETLHPQVIITKEPYVFCDLAGLFDTKGPETRICAAESVHMLAATTGKIKGIIVMLDVDGFTANKGSAFKKTALALARITRNSPELLDSVCFVITKVGIGATVTPAAIIKNYMSNILNSPNGLEDQAKQRQLDADEQALLIMLRQMCNREQQIVIASITDKGTTRNLITTKLAAFNAHAAAEYDFLNVDDYQIQFNQLIKYLATRFVTARIQFIVTIPQQIISVELKLTAARAGLKDIQDKEITNNDKIAQYVYKIARVDELLKSREYAKSIHQANHLHNNCPGCLRTFERITKDIVEKNSLKAELSVALEQHKQEQQQIRANLLHMKAEIARHTDTLAKLKQSKQELKTEITDNQETINEAFSISKLMNMDLQVNGYSFWQEFAKYRHSLHPSKRPASPQIPCKLLLS